MASLQQLNLYVDEMVKMLKRSEQLQSTGFQEDSHSIDAEWMDSSVTDAVFLSRDSLVRLR